MINLYEVAETNQMIQEENRKRQEAIIKEAE